MASRPTIHDVAKAAGVSVTTVSHALNGKGRVDPQTRALVNQVVHRLGYRANRHARGLRSGRSGTLGLLLPVSGDVRSDETLRLDYYMRLAGAAATAAFAREHALMLLPPVIGGAGLGGLAIDGGIVADPSPNDERMTVLLNQGLPAVTIGRDLGRPDHTWYVELDNYANTRQVLDHLAERGAKRIAILTPRAGWAWATETLRAYESWTGEHGFPRLVTPVAMQPGEHSAFQAASRLLAARTPPDAVFVVAERFIRGVLRAARESGKQVPSELLLAAGVDGVYAWEGDPPVTALELHPERMAEAAVTMLLARIDGDSEEPPAHVPATLHVRASTGGLLTAPGR
ncbi:MAG: LacI family DNA-binding transcriptional regulator [Streptosporangiaceae bacterium]